MGAALVGNSEAMGAIPSKISSHTKKKCFKLLRPKNLQNLKTFLTLELIQYYKSGSMLSSSKPKRVEPAVTAAWADYKTLCVC